MYSILLLDMIFNRCYDSLLCVRLVIMRFIKHNLINHYAFDSVIRYNFINAIIFNKFKASNITFYLIKIASCNGRNMSL